MDDTTNKVKEIVDVIENATLKTLQESLSAYHPSDLAEAFTELDEEQRKALVKTVNFHMLAAMFEYVDDELAAHIIESLEFQKSANILQTMDPDDATDIVQEIKQSKIDSILALMHKKRRDTLNKLRCYKEDTAGSIMTTDFIALKKGMDIKDAMRHLIENASSTEGIQRLFVLDDNAFLEGVIELKKLIQARAPQIIDDLMITDVTTVRATDDQEEVSRKIQNYGMSLMPVVNEKNQLQGVITLDDAADILDAETDEDYGLLAMVSSDIVLRDTVFKSAFHRLPWLIMLLFLGLIISTIISQFEDTIAKVTVLVIFQPLILDMAGNTGTQSLAVTVRGLSKQNYMFKGQGKKHMIKEFKIGTFNGLAIGLFSTLTTFIFLSLMSPAMDIGTPIQVAMTVGLSAAIALTFAAFFGSFFPLFLHKIKIDPAVASGPFITTLNDIIGLIIYFTLAMLIIL